VRSPAPLKILFADDKVELCGKLIAPSSSLLLDSVVPLPEFPSPHGKGARCD
jgi:hypothetical protein